MTPMLGIMASQISGRLSSFDSIATSVAGVGGTTSVTFSSIPSTYTHLQIRVYGIVAAGVTNLAVQFNGDTASNYWWHQLYGTGAAAGANNGGALGPFMYMPPSAAQPSAMVLDILDYTNTNKYKTMRGIGGSDTNGAGQISLSSGMWNSTAAITSITLYGATYAQYSSFAL
jgi:hypothetical protein